MDLDSVHSVYFLGIGGIGMSSLARYFHAMGKDVAGYDLTPSAITDDLRKLGIHIHFSDDIEQIPEKFTEKENTLVIRTPAVPARHTEYQYFIDNGFEIRKRSEVLGLLFNTSKGIAIAGTHGKTSVTSMLAYIMDQSDQGCNAFLGGILKNIGSNLVLNPSSDWVVAEADEFDRSFLQLKPQISLVTWVDADHLDIYLSHADIQQAFTEFLQQTKPGGTIILKKGIDLGFNKAHYRCYQYSLNDVADFYAENIRIEHGQYRFSIITPNGIISDVFLQAIGITNVENAVAAAALAWAAGVENDQIKLGLSSFAGVRRRFDVQVNTPKHVYIDDYAHHPRELDAVIGSVKKLYPHRKITGVFQPHLFSRTNDFSREFAESLSSLDELILLDIYPAREEPIPGVSSKLIFDDVSIRNKELCSKDKLLDVIRNKKLEVLLTMGAGDIDRFVQPIKELMEK